MPASPTEFEELLARAVEVLHLGLHPVSTLLARLLGVRAPGDLDLAMWALLAWFMGSRESEAVKKAGFVVAAALLALAALEVTLQMG